jgi:hypothetical protein
MHNSRSALLGTALVAAIGCLLCIGIIAYSFARGLDMADGAFDFYRLSHPYAPLPFMDHFFWGQFVSVARLNHLGVRWIGLLLLLGSAWFLCVASISAILTSSPGANPFSLLDWTFAISLSTLGALFSCSLARPNLNYSDTLVMSFCIFAGAMFLVKDTRNGTDLSLNVVMGTMAALVFMARPPAIVLLAGYFLACSAVTRKKFGMVARSFLVVSATATLLILLCLYSGYDIRDQFLLLHVLASTDHRPIDFVRANVKPGLLILLAALLGAAGYALVRRNVPKAMIGWILWSSLAGGATAILAYMLVTGQFGDLLPHDDLLYRNAIAVRNLGLVFHAGALSLLLTRGAAILSARYPALREWFEQEISPATSTVWCFAAMLYILSLLPVVGSNNVIWRQSSISMAPLFLSIALVLCDALRDSETRAWIPPMLGLFAVPVVAAVYTGLIAQPINVNGGTRFQTVGLDHPQFLSGLLVLPKIATLQREFERELRREHFVSGPDTMLPNLRSDGVIELVGGTALGGGLFYQPPGNRGQLFNCTMANIGLRRPVRRIFAINVEELGDGFKSCLQGYELTSSRALSGNVTITIFKRRAREDSAYITQFGRSTVP